jgi:hypothetical protein
VPVAVDSRQAALFTGKDRHKQMGFMSTMKTRTACNSGRTLIFYQGKAESLHEFLALVPRGSLWTEAV